MGKYVIIYLVVGVIYVATHFYLVFAFPNFRFARRLKAVKRDAAKYGRVGIEGYKFGIIFASAVGIVVWPISLLIDILPSKSDKEKLK